MNVLGIDPGKATGYALISIGEDHKVTPRDVGVTRDMQLVELQDIIRQADIVVYEDFLIRPDKALKGDFNWKSTEAEKVIGSLLTFCKLMGNKQVVKQQPAQRIPGIGFAGLQYKRGAKGRHWEDALAHAMFYAVRHLNALPVDKR